jgi:hypothetical protein
VNPHIHGGGGGGHSVQILRNNELEKAFSKPQFFLSLKGNGILGERRSFSALVLMVNIKTVTFSASNTFRTHKKIRLIRRLINGSTVVSVAEDHLE